MCEGFDYMDLPPRWARQQAKETHMMAPKSRIKVGVGQVLWLISSLPCYMIDLPYSLYESPCSVNKEDDT